MREFFPKEKEISAGIADAADRKFSHSGRLKTGKLNRKQYICHLKSFPLDFIEF